MCAALVVISLAALRTTTTPDAPVKLTAGSRVDFVSRLSSARASRGAVRALLFPATTTATTATTLPPPPPPPPPTVKPTPILHRAPATTAKPRPKTTAAPKPAASRPPAPASAPTPAPAPAPSATRPMPTGGSIADGSEEGKASYYEARYHQSNPWICAHKTLPMGTVLTVVDLDNGKSIKCEVGDRGPYTAGRVVDLSKYAFSQMASPSAGVIHVKISW